MLLQDEQYIIKWLSQYGTLTKTQVIRLLKDKPVSTAEKIIRNFVNRLLGIRFTIRILLLNQTKGYEILQICGACTRILTYLRGNLRQS